MDFEAQIIDTVIITDILRIYAQRSRARRDSHLYGEGGGVEWLT